MTEPNQNIRFASEAVVDSIILKSYNGDELDITALCENFNIYEDIFSNTLSGDVLITDALGLLSSFPIIGREIIEITFRAKIDLKSKKCIFETYRLSDIIRADQDNVQMYTLYFASPELLRNRKLKLSKAYENKHSEIVKNIYENILKTPDNNKELVYLETSDTERMLFPYWNPLRCINYITTRCRKDDDVSFLFYETLDNFNFIPLGYLAKQKVKHRFTRAIVNQIDPESRSRDIITPFITTENVNIKSPFNQLDKIGRGAYSSSVLYYDPLYRDYGVDTYSYTRDYNENISLNDYKILPENENLSDKFQSSVNFVPTHTNRNGDVQSDFVEESYLKRTAQLNQYDNNVVITVSGTLDLKVGNIVFLEIPSTKAPRETNRETDKVYSGKYMIRSIRHTVVRNQDYKCVLTLMRDSLAVSLPDSKEKTDIYS